VIHDPAPTCEAAAERRLGTVERAYQLAKSGQCTRLDDIRSRLIHEGYEAVQQHLGAPSLRRDLTRLCREGRG
jgi:hypothetical protein